MLTRLVINKKAFTLIELMIVVTIIGILAALAIPRFMRTSTQAKQSEAKKILKQIYICQRTYRQEKDTYTCNGQNASAGEEFPQIWIEIMQNSRYTYSIVADSNTFTATASGNIDDDITLDTWTIDEDGDLQCNSNDAMS